MFVCLPLCVCLSVSAGCFTDLDAGFRKPCCLGQALPDADAWIWISLEGGLEQIHVLLGKACPLPATGAAGPRRRVTGPRWALTCGEQHQVREGKEEEEGQQPPPPVHPPSVQVENHPHLTDFLQNFVLSPITCPFTHIHADFPVLQFKHHILYSTV